MAGKFQIGDIVRLKSGGPDMTVNAVNVGVTGKQVYCVWFAGKKHEGAQFHPDVLEPVESKAPEK